MEDIVQGSDGYFTVCVKNYAAKNKYEIEIYFAQFGTVVSVRTIEKDPRLAFVRYTYKEEVMKCLERTKDDPIYQVSMANTRPRGGNTPGSEPHVKPCGLNQPVLQNLLPQDKQKKSAPSGDTARDKQPKSAPSGDTEREENWDADITECDKYSLLGASGNTNGEEHSFFGASGSTNGDGRGKLTLFRGTARDKQPKSVPSGDSERDGRGELTLFRGTARGKQPKSAPSGDTERDGRGELTLFRGTARGKQPKSAPSGDTEREENWDADITECGPSQDTKSNESCRLGHPVIDIVVVADLPDDIRPREMYILCYDADPLFISPFKRIESKDNTLYCIVHLDKETADELVNKLDGKLFKGKKLIAFRMEKQYL